MPDQISATSNPALHMHMCAITVSAADFPPHTTNNIQRKNVWDCEIKKYIYNSEKIVSIHDGVIN